MRNLGNGLEVRHVVARVADALDVDGLGLVVNQGSNLVGVVAVDEFGLDSEARQEDFELVVCAAVEVRRGDDVVAGVGKRVDGDELGTLARRGSESGSTAFQSSNSLLENIDSRLCGVKGVLPRQTRCPWGAATYVHDSGVNVAKLLEAE